MKYLGNQPFQVGGSTEKYRDGWERVFGKRCEWCGGKGRLGVELNALNPSATSAVLDVPCEPCGGTGKERA